METERIVLAQIVSKDGNINIEFPNIKDVYSFELYEFLKCYVKALEEELLGSFDPLEDGSM